VGVLVTCILYSEVFLNLIEVFLTLTEVIPRFYLSCKANARVKLAKTGHGLLSSKLVVICVVLLLFVLFYVLFVCKCVLYYCHRVTTQLQLTNISFAFIQNCYAFQPLRCKCVELLKFLFFMKGCSFSQILFITIHYCI
jgi:hypothetical protein